MHLAEVENILARLAESGGVAVIGAREERVGEVCCVVSTLQGQAKRSVEVIFGYGRLKLVWFKQS